MARTVASHSRESTADPDAYHYASSDQLSDRDEPLASILADLFERDAAPERLKRHLFKILWTSVALVVVAMIGAGLVLYRNQLAPYRDQLLRYRDQGWRLPAPLAVSAPLPLATEGTAMINSHPDGALVVIDGEQR